MTRIIFFLLIFTSFACVSQEHRTTRAKASSDFIRITGRVKNQHDSVCIYWPGTSMLIRFRGTSLSATLSDGSGQNYFNVIIDGDSLHYMKLDKGKRSYTLAGGLNSGQHTVELVKRTEWDQGNTWFYGMETNGALEPLPPPNKRTIEFFGNSITAGYAIEDYSGKDSPEGTNTNNYYTYAALTARHYNANLYCTVKSGIGLTISWFPLIMPEMYDRLDPADATSKWDFKQVSPDIVVINILQNDSWLVKKPDHPSFKQRFGATAPSEKEFIVAYKNFLSLVRDVYPNAHIICSLGPMDAMREGAPWSGYISAAVDQLDDAKIYIHFFPFNNKAGHPRKEDNAKMAESLIAFIDANIKW